MAQFHQDWSQNVVTNRDFNKPSGSAGGSQAGAGKKKKRGKKSKATAEQKAEVEETNFAVKKVDANFSVALQRARIAKGWKQEDLAHRLNVHKTVVNQYESGKAIPSSQLIALMNRILGVKLPAINKPKAGKKKKKTSK